MEWFSRLAPAHTLGAPSYFGVRGVVNKKDMGNEQRGQACTTEKEVGKNCESLSITKLCRAYPSRHFIKTFIEVKRRASSTHEIVLHGQLSVSDEMASSLTSIPPGLSNPLITSNALADLL